MTEHQLQQIEAELNLHLPDNYRQAALQSPFQAMENRSLYWMADDPESVIQETLFPLEDGAYDKANWRETFVCFGRSPGGDLYLLDTARADSPVFCLSHEDYTIVEEYPTFEAFVADYQQLPQRAAQEEAAWRQQVQEQSRRVRRGAWAVLLFVLVLSAIPLLLAWQAARGQ